MAIHPRRRREEGGGRVDSSCRFNFSTSNTYTAFTNVGGSIQNVNIFRFQVRLATEGRREGGREEGILLARRLAVYVRTYVRGGPAIYLDLAGTCTCAVLDSRVTGYPPSRGGLAHSLTHSLTLTHTIPYHVTPSTYTITPNCLLTHSLTVSHSTT